MMDDLFGKKDSFNDDGDDYLKSLKKKNSVDGGKGWKPPGVKKREDAPKPSPRSR